MGWDNSYQTILVIPTGATSGQRIVIDGTTGLISIYNSAGVLVDQFGGPNGAVIMGAAPGPEFEFNEPTAGILTTLDASGNISAQWNPAGNTFTMLDNTNLKFVQITGSQVAWGVISAAGVLPTAAEITDAATVATVITTTPADQASLTMTSPNGVIAALDDTTTFEVYSGQQNANYTDGSGGPFVAMFDAASNSPVNLYVSGVIYATDNSSATWQWTSPTLATGWSTSAIRSGRPLQFCVTPLDDVHFAGSVNTTSATPTNPIFSTSGVIPNPAHNQPMECIHQNSAGTLLGIATGFWTTSGAFEFFSAGTVSTGDIFTFNEHLPLDRRN